MIFVCVYCAQTHMDRRIVKSLADSDEEDLEALRLAALKSLRQKVKYQEKQLKGMSRSIPIPEIKININTRTAIGHFKLTFASVSKQVLVQSLELFLFTCK